MSHVPVIVAPENASTAEWQRREASVRRLYITGTCVLREGKPLQKTSGPPGWGLGVGPTTPPRKNYQVTETANMNSNPQSPMEISSQAPELGSMTAPSGNPSGEAMSSRRIFLWADIRHMWKEASDWLIPINEASDWLKFWWRHQGGHYHVHTWKWSDLIG